MTLLLYRLARWLVARTRPRTVDALDCSPDALGSYWDTDPAAYRRCVDAIG